MYVCDVLMRSIDRDVETSRRSCESTVIHTVCMLVVGGGSPCMEVRVRGWLVCVCVCGLRGDGRGRDVRVGSWRIQACTKGRSAGVYEYPVSLS